MSPRDVVMTTRTATGELLAITPGIAGGDGPEYWEMREHLQNNGGSVDWDYWRNLSQWTPTEAACLADAVDPFFKEPPSGTRHYNNEAHAHTCPASDEIEKIERWCKDKSEAPLSPAAWVRILRERGYSLPPALASLGADEPTQSNTTTGKDAAKRTRTDCLKDAMLAAVSTLRRELGRNPNVGEVREYLGNRDTTGYIVSVTDALVTWRDWNGKEDTADYRKMKERLGRIPE